MLSQSLIQFSVEGWGCVSSLLLHLRPNCHGGNEDNVTSFKWSQACTTLGAPDPAAGYRLPTPLLETPGLSWESLAQSLVGSLLISHGSWCTQGSVCAVQESVSPVLHKL